MSLKILDCALSKCWDGGASPGFFVLGSPADTGKEHPLLCDTSFREQKHCNPRSICGAHFLPQLGV
jgi:hypothetical protein